jgi:hypothetical protein
MISFPSPQDFHHGYPAPRPTETRPESLLVQYLGDLRETELWTLRYRVAEDSHSVKRRSFSVVKTERLSTFASAGLTPHPLAGFAHFFDDVPLVQFGHHLTGSL